ncbi:hypothetical protein GOP47_0016054 [Adiantum capillus-veneris]|uniref:Uncharacterized protein n=1 Tax=Adiantum capillus-veneris TaxID=13818 RepID=A0A9D4ULZ4_ADICA|nr:hypothetical protein GOP47_0016054 [Adiantum capillus-veneris]
MDILSQKISFQPGISNVKGRLFADSMQEKLANTISKSYDKKVRAMLVNARAQFNSKNYVSEKGSFKPDVSNNGYETLTGGKMSSVDDGRGQDGVMGYGTNLQGCDNEYSRLKLGKNVLNFFHVSHKLSHSRVDTSVADEFEELMDVGTVLLTEGEQGLDGRLEVGVASRMLKEAAVRFAAASAINPSSVAAVNAWGTTLLAHGKLKLILSEKLRDMLLEAGSPRKKLDPEGTVINLEDMIPKVCEECEKLLMEAGRKFGKAVSLDKSNDFALYNWGQALFYRARLIAADGLEDAVKDADKIYLTAIDKFKATLQLAKDYSGAAYFSWGLALRDRYWLHGLASKPDVQLLEQAKWASEQAVRAYPDGLEAKLVVQACMEELAQVQTQ